LLRHEPKKIESARRNVKVWDLRMAAQIGGGSGGGKTGVRN
jgi:hypothetical protein